MNKLSSKLVSIVDSILPRFIQVPLIAVLGGKSLRHGDDNKNSKSYLYRTLSNEYGKKDFIGVTGSNRESHYRIFNIEDEKLKTEIKVGRFENNGGVEITLDIEDLYRAGIKMGMYFGHDSLKLSSIQSYAKGEGYKDFTRTLGTPPTNLCSY